MNSQKLNVEKLNKLEFSRDDLILSADKLARVAPGRVAGNRLPIQESKRPSPKSEDSANRDAKVTALLNDASGGSPLTSSAHAVDSYPTEQRTRQKARQKASHVAKKRPQIVEDRHDDCGEDFGPLGEEDYFAGEEDSFYLSLIHI